MTNITARLILQPSSSCRLKQDNYHFKVALGMFASVTSGHENFTDCQFLSFSVNVSLASNSYNKIDGSRRDRPNVHPFKSVYTNRPQVSSVSVHKSTAVGRNSGKLGLGGLYRFRPLQD